MDGHGIVECSKIKGMDSGEKFETEKILYVSNVYVSLILLVIADQE